MKINTCAWNNEIYGRLEWNDKITWTSGTATRGESEASERNARLNNSANERTSDRLPGGGGGGGGGLTQRESEKK